MWYFIPSKWEFICLWCLENNQPILARKALEIDMTLREIYGNTLTEDWIHDFIIEYMSTNVNTEALCKIMSSKDYCIACVKELSCITCTFGEKYSICFVPKSLYHNFSKKIQKGF